MLGQEVQHACDFGFNSDPDILGGTVVFVGTRVPLHTLLDYLEAGQPLDEFLDDFPSVTREQAVAGLRLIDEGVILEGRHSS